MVVGTNCHSEATSITPILQAKPGARITVPQPRGHLALELLPPPLYPIVVYDETAKLLAN
uniref:Uncharacterized protein n=1 Tax=Arundo donax TaxID=35708 RepID=A0A0A9ANV4_ARUDO